VSDLITCVVHPLRRVKNCSDFYRRQILLYCSTLLPFNNLPSWSDQLEPWPWLGKPSFVNLLKEGEGYPFARLRIARRPFNILILNLATPYARGPRVPPLQYVRAESNALLLFFGPGKTDLRPLPTLNLATPCARGLRVPPLQYAYAKGNALFNVSLLPSPTYDTSAGLQQI